MSNLHHKVNELRKNALPISFGSMEIRARAERGNIPDDVIAGYACIWNVPDDYGTVWIKGAFAKSISERGPQSNSKYKITGVWQHDLCDPIGRITILEEDEIGLYFEIKCDMSVESAKRAKEQVDSGTINQFSFGFDYVWDKITWNEVLDVLEVREAELYEISPVTIASQMMTYAVRSFKNNDDALIDLNQKMESFIKSIPNNRQLELRQLITDLITLRTTEPQETRANALRKTEPQDGQIDYKHLLENFKL